MSLTKNQLDIVKGYRDAVGRFMTSASNPGGRELAFRNEPGAPYHEMILAQYAVDALLHGGGADEPAASLSPELRISGQWLDIPECRCEEVICGGVSSWNTSSCPRHAVNRGERHE